MIGKTGFASVNQVTKQATDSMSGVVHTRLAGDTKRNDHGHYYWTEAFGSYQERPKASNVVRTDSTVGGLLVGFDKNHSEKTVIGAYVGGLKVKDAANGIVSDTNQSIDSSGAVIGGYSSTKLAHDAFVDVNLPVGYTQNKSKRTVYNNLVAGGIEYDNGKIIK